jgi:hypothetical protein
MSKLLLRTSIRTQTKKHAVFLGTILAAVALSCLWVVELILPLLGLESMGGWAWMLRGAFVSSGFVPYQKVSWQKNHPDILEVDEKSLALCKDGNTLFSLNWSQVESFTFLDRGAIYGIAFTLTHEKSALSLFKNKSAQNAETLSYLLSSLQELSDKPPEAKTSQSPYNIQAPPKIILEESRKKYGVDIFLPYFTERSYLMLEQWYQQNIKTPLEEARIETSSRG